MRFWAKRFRLWKRVPGRQPKTPDFLAKCARKWAFLNFQTGSMAICWCQQANIALAALAEQSQYGVSQKYVLGNFWTPSEAFGLAMENQSTDDMQSLLDSMVAQITG